jgi:amino acid permease
MAIRPSIPTNFIIIIIIIFYSKMTNSLFYVSSFFGYFLCAQCVLFVFLLSRENKNSVLHQPDDANNDECGHTGPTVTKLLFP